MENFKELIPKYENRKYFEKDPVSFLWKYKDKRDIEVAAVICSVLALGNRQQIYKACEKTLAIMGDSPFQYIMNGIWENGNNCWYRMLKWNDFYSICDRLLSVYLMHKDLEYVVSLNVELGDSQIESIIDVLGGIKGFPKDKKSCCKRINLMLRWLVRQNSPIDVGIWKSLDQSKLLLPLDVHSLNTLREIGAIKRKSNDMKTVIEGTNWAKTICPDDPASLDFYLFGKSYEEAHPEEFEEEENIQMTPNQIILLSVYLCMAVNEIACCCVLDIEPSIKDKDKETQKIYYAAKRRVMWYQNEVNSLTVSSGNIYANFMDTLDDYIQPILGEYRDGLYKYLATIKGVENPYLYALVELARSTTKFSIQEISNIIIECQKYDEKAISLRHYKMQELLDIMGNLTKWVFRKADDINYNDSAECVNAYCKFVDTLRNPNILGECIIKAQQLEDKNNESKI